MTLPIQWRVLPGPFAGHLLLCAELVHAGQRYTKQMAMPPAFSKRTWWLAIAAVKAEIENAVKTPPADR